MPEVGGMSYVVEIIRAVQKQELVELIDEDPELSVTGEGECGLGRV